MQGSRSSISNCAHYEGPYGSFGRLSKPLKDILASNSIPQISTSSGIKKQERKIQQEQSRPMRLDYQQQSKGEIRLFPPHYAAMTRSEHLDALLAKFSSDQYVIQHKDIVDLKERLTAIERIEKVAQIAAGTEDSLLQLHKEHQELHLLKSRIENNIQLMSSEETSPSNTLCNNNDDIPSFDFSAELNQLKVYQERIELLSKEIEELTASSTLNPSKMLKSLDNAESKMKEELQVWRKQYPGALKIEQLLLNYIGTLQYESSHLPDKQRDKDSTPFVLGTLEENLDRLYKGNKQNDYASSLNKLLEVEELRNAFNRQFGLLRGQFLKAVYRTLGSLKKEWNKRVS